MKNGTNFNIKLAIEEWLKNNSRNISPTKLPEKNRDEILKQNITDLQRMELSNEEIFEVLKIRFEPETPKKNFFDRIIPEYLPLTEMLFLFYGGMLYLIIQYLVLSLADFIYLTLETYNKGNVIANFKVVQHFWQIIIFILLISIVTIFYNANELFKYFRSFKITFIKVLLLFLTMLGSMIFQRYVWFYVNATRKNYWDLIIYYINHQNNKLLFTDWFPAIIVVCYVLLYYNFKKQSYLY